MQKKWAHSHRCMVPDLLLRHIGDLFGFGPIRDVSSAFMASEKEHVCMKLAVVFGQLFQIKSCHCKGGN